ncbi:MAG: DUF882 domain-containing protein [Pseudomonadota bacterium]
MRIITPNRSRIRPAGFAAGLKVRRAAAALLCAAVVGVAVSVLPATASANTRTLDLYFTHTKERLKVTYKRNGRFVASGLRDLNRFLRDWRRNESTKMDPELFDLLWEVQQQFGGRTIHVVSAYRSPATNTMLRRRSRGVARNSQHMAGRAIDFFIEGANMARVREAGMKRQVGGVGYYPRSGTAFVHFDTGRVRSWPRMSRRQLAKLFPNGKTMHLPRSGKPLSGYKAAVAAEKQGKLASLNGGGSIAGGVRSLFGFGGSRQQVASNDPQRGVLRQQQRSESRAAAALRDDEPVRVRTASLGPSARQSAPPEAARRAEPEAAQEEERKGLFRQLPSVSLGGLIGRFRRDEAEAEPEVTPVALPQEPLSAVAVTGAEPTPEPTEDRIGGIIEAGTPAPVPRMPPRERRSVPGASVVADAAGRPAGEDASNQSVELASLPQQQPGEATPETLRDGIPSSLGYVTPGVEVPDASAPLASTAALVPRSLTQTPDGAQTSQPLPRDVRILQAQFAPMRGASPLLIADGSKVGASGFAELSAPDRGVAAREGLLLADGFIGAPTRFTSGTNWPSTEGFRGLRITVFARPKS